jgi:molybdopterin molybdotransferase
MITLDDAYNAIDTITKQIKLSTEKIAVPDALHRVLASEVKSKLELPPFNKAAMDGFAIMQNDRKPSYKVNEIIAAGQMPTKELSPGYSTQVMTGAPVPKGTWQVIPVEFTERADDQVRILQYPQAQHICQQGEDVKSGVVIANQGEVLTPAVIANLISCGITEIKVYAKPQIAILSTGDEIVESIAAIKPGKIMDSNRPMLEALCKKNNYTINYSNKVSDDLAATKSILTEALDKADIIILSGGVSMGEFDYVGQAIHELGFTIHFDRVAIKPGKPTTFASKGNKLIFALPGNPVAVYLTFQLFVRRAVALMQNKNIIFPHNLPLACDYTRKKTDRMAFVPYELTQHGKIKPIDYHGSAHLLALANADGFFMVDKDVRQIEQDDVVNCVL